MNKTTAFSIRRPFLLAVMAVFMFVFAISAKAVEPPTEPLLRIETGMHSAAISRLGVDAQNRFLVTDSDDKTIRVWDLPSINLIKIIRPPIGEGNEGKLYSLALSPDGRTIAVGGWTGWDWEGKSYIYFFDRETGALIHRIDGLPNVTFHLVYSKDGRYLAASLGSQGVMVWRTVDYRLVGEDTDYGERSSWADFDSSNRLVTACYDGYVRLYEVNESAYPALKLIAKSKPPDAGQVFSTSFSPDGSKIAVGYNGSLKVNVLSGRDLSFLYRPDTSDLSDTGHFAVTAWSADGRYLYAGKGLWGWFNIRKWYDEGRGSHTDIRAAENSIRHIVALKNGSIVYGSYDPALGIIDANGVRTLYKPPYIADHRENKKGLMLSDDGMTVQFAYELWGESQARFSIKGRVLTDANTPSAEVLSPPLTYTYGINVTNWKNNTAPELNGRRLDLGGDGDRSRSLAIAPDGQSFALGTEWRIRLFDKDGNQRWEAATPSAAWAVNISGNGKLVVAAFGDGTLRWFSMTDGKELLSFFPHGDKKRWVVWTSSGYYDASSGADDLIGWHINNGKDQAADFFPAGRFRSTFYRADIVAKVLTTFDEPTAIRLANEDSGKRVQQVSIEKALPPIVTILEPRDSQSVSANVVNVRYIVRSPSGEPVTGVKALVDGRPVAQQRGLQIVAKDKDREEREMQVTLPEKDSEISIIAENRFTSSEPATVRVKWAGAKGDEFVIKPKLYVLAIGVSNYHDKNLTLALAAKDAQDFADALSRQKDGIYRDVLVKVLTDETATKDDILDGLEWIQRETTSKDVAMVFLSGHGVNDSSGVYYYLPVGVQTDKLKRTAVAFSDIKNTVASLAGKTVLFVDTCHSGNIMGTRRGIADINAVVNELASAENGAVVFASSTGNQYSLENPAWGNGAFTKALVEGLSGKADYTGKGKISVNMLDLYISERVKELTKGSQTPTTTKPATVSDFPVAVSR